MAADSLKFISVKFTKKHTLLTLASEGESNERYECWQKSSSVKITLLVNNYTDWMKRFLK